MHLVRIYEGSEGGGTFGERSFIGSGYTKVTRRSRGAHGSQCIWSVHEQDIRWRRRRAEQPECRAYCEYREYPE